MEITKYFQFEFGFQHLLCLLDEVRIRTVYVDVVTLEDVYASFPQGTLLRRQNAASVYDAVAGENNEQRASMFNPELMGTGLRIVLCRLNFFQVAFLRGL